MDQATLSIGVIMPSRLQRIRPDDPQSPTFVERAIASALAQTLVQEGGAVLTFIVGIDADAEVPEPIAARPDVVLARSAARSQVGALNAGIAAAGDRFDRVTFLEDDDRWDPNYLTWTLAALRTHGFVSTTQIEVDEADQIVRINDFPTPSGWMMTPETLRRVGAFDPALRWHLDNEWLGRLAERGVRRCHLVELTAPTTLEAAQQVRPWIANVLRNGGPAVSILRHSQLTPLVIRLVHPRSGMGRIATDPALAQQSTAEYEALVRRFGRIPW